MHMRLIGEVPVGRDLRRLDPRSEVDPRCTYPEDALQRFGSVAEMSQGMAVEGARRTTEQTGDLVDAATTRQRIRDRSDPSGHLPSTRVGESTQHR